MLTLLVSRDLTVCNRILPDGRSAPMLIQSMNLSGVAGMWPVAGCSRMHTRLTQHGTCRLSSIAKLWTTPARCLCHSQATDNPGNSDGEDPIEGKHNKS